jgi:hypothetical protein
LVAARVEGQYDRPVNETGGHLSSSVSDSELKARHRAIWASGDYPDMVETFLLPLGPRLVEACGIGVAGEAGIKDKGQTSKTFAGSPAPL